MLLDSNIIVYATHPDQDSLRRFIAENTSSVSIISYVEVLGYHRLTDVERDLIRGFFASIDLLPLTNDVAEEAIRLRQRRRMSLGDALIAATALVNSLTLVTHNTDDFRWIPELNLHDPVA